MNDGVLSQRAVGNRLAVCRHIVRILSDLLWLLIGLKKPWSSLHYLKHNEPTPWNSTLHMLQSILEQKMTLAAYATEHNISQFTSEQLQLVNKIVAVLKQIDEITLSISTNHVSITIVIPFIRALTTTLEKTDDEGARTMKRQMLGSLNRMYQDVEDNTFLVLVTLLDLRIKDKYFSSLVKSLNAISHLEEEVRSAQAQDMEDSQQSFSP